MEITKLTDRTLKKIKSRDKRYRILVKGSPGLILLVNPTGTISFQYRFQLNGNRRGITLGSYPAMTMQALMAEYSTMVNQVKQGIDPLREKELQQQQEEDEPLFKDFAERFVLNHCKKKLRAATAKEYERQIRKHLIPVWGKYKVTEIQRKQIVGLVEKMSNHAPVQANRTLATIKKLFSYAFDIGLVEINPASPVKPPAKETPRNRVLDMDEIVILFKKLETLPNTETRDFLQLMTLTAQRPGEVAGLRLKQLKRDNDGLWLELSGGLTTKNGEPQRIFLNDQAEKIIQRRVDDLRVKTFFFPARTKSGHTEVTTMNDRTRKLQPIKSVEYFRPHDLRRSATTGIARLGYGAVVDDILNHKKQGVTRRVYDLYSRAPEIKRALTAWGEAIQMALDGNAGKIIPIVQGR